MSKEANAKAVGAFVVVGVALAITAVLVFGAGEILQKKRVNVVYFDGSVRGLNVGAPVTLRGVEIGEVTSVVAEYSGETGEIGIEVLFELNPGTVKVAGPQPSDAEYRKALEELFEQGVRAQLETQSMLTGLKFIELDFFPDAPMVLHGTDTGYLEFPSVPTGMQEIRRTAEDALDAIAALPIEEVLQELQRALEGVDRFVRSPELSQAVASFTDAMRTAGQVAGNLETELTPTLASVHRASDTMDSTLVQARETLASFETLATETSSELVFEIANTLDDLSTAATAFRVLAEYLEQHPEALIVGKGGRGE